MYNCQNTTITDYLLIAGEVVVIGVFVMALAALIRATVRKGVSYVLDCVHRIARRG